MCLQARKGDDDWHDVEMLVPFVDLINTGYPDEINLVCRTEAQSLYVDCVTDRDIQPGTEVSRAASTGRTSAQDSPRTPRVFGERRGVAT